MELPCTVIEVMEYSGNRVFATHYGFGGKYACLRGIAEFPVVTVCCFRHHLVSPLGSQGGWSVTAEAAGSSPVVPAIHSKSLALISAKPSRAQKGHITDCYETG